MAAITQDGPMILLGVISDIVREKVQNILTAIILWQLHMQNAMILVERQ